MSGARVAVVSGAGRGIGRAVAERLLAGGWNVSLGLRGAHDRWRDGPGVHTFGYDAMAGGEEAWVAAAMGRFGRVDAVVANAGVMVPGSVAEMGDADFAAMWRINVQAPQRLARAAFPALARSGRGRIVVMASLSGKRVASADSSAYAVTKHAAVALAHGLRQAGFDRGIRATAVCPGFVSSDMGRALAPFDPALMTKPEEIAEVVMHAIELPNGASVAEIAVNCRAEPLF